MSKTLSIHIAVTLAALWWAVPTAAQELTPGTWTGTMAPPGASAIPVVFEVGGTGAALSIVMRSVLVQEEMHFQDVRVDGSQLTFWWEPGVRVDCTLQRTPAGGFEGPCVGAGGPQGAARMTMVPPDRS